MRHTMHNLVGPCQRPSCRPCSHSQPCVQHADNMHSGMPRRHDPGVYVHAACIRQACSMAHGHGTRYAARTYERDVGLDKVKVMAHIVMACIVMACIVMACIVMAYTGMAYIVMACIVMATIESIGSEACAGSEGRAYARTRMHAHAEQVRTEAKKVSDTVLNDIIHCSKRLLQTTLQCEHCPVGCTHSSGHWMSCGTKRPSANAVGTRCWRRASGTTALMCTRARALSRATHKLCMLSVRPSWARTCVSMEACRHTHSR